MLIFSRSPQQGHTIMETVITYNPENYPAKINNLIMRKAEEWQVPPSEALARLLDELAAKEEEKHAA